MKDKKQSDDCIHACVCELAGQGQCPCEHYACPTPDVAAMVEAIASELLNNYMVVAHDGRGLRGEHYYVKHPELCGLLTSMMHRYHDAHDAQQQAPAEPVWLTGNENKADGNRPCGDKATTPAEIDPIRTGSTQFCHVCNRVPCECPPVPDAPVEDEPRNGLEIKGYPECVACKHDATLGIEEPCLTCLRAGNAYLYTPSEIAPGPAATGWDAALMADRSGDQDTLPPCSLCGKSKYPVEYGERNNPLPAGIWVYYDDGTRCWICRKCSRKEGVYDTLEATHAQHKRETAQCADGLTADGMIPNTTGGQDDD